MEGTCNPTRGNAYVGRPHRLVHKVVSVELGVVEHQPASNRDHGEGVDGCDDTEPQPGDDNLAENVRACVLLDACLNAFHLGQDSDSEKDSAEAVVACQGEDHLVSSLAPHVFVRK